MGLTPFATIVGKNRLASVATEDDVVDGIVKMDTKFTSHAGVISKECPKIKTPGYPLTSYADKGGLLDVGNNLQVCTKNDTYLI